MNNQPKPVPGLKTRGRALWRAVVESYDLRADELIILEQACRLLDELVQIEDAMKDTALLVEGYRGSKRANPLLGEARSHRLALARVMQTLAVPEEALNKSSAGRKLALLRWNNAS